MVSTLNPPPLFQGEKRVSLHNLTWTNYQRILAALPQTRAAHLTYDCGTLEISMPLEDHEQASELIGLLIRILVVEMGLKLKSMRSTTLDREDLDRGAEPDNAIHPSTVFYRDFIFKLKSLKCPNYLVPQPHEAS